MLFMHMSYNTNRNFLFSLRVCLYSYKALQKSFGTDYHELLIGELAASRTPSSPVPKWEYCGYVLYH